MPADRSCTCIPCDDCGGAGNIWRDVSGRWLGDRRCDDLDTMEGCEECGGSGIAEICDHCREALEEDADNER